MDIAALREAHPEHWRLASAIRALTLDAVAAAGVGSAVTVRSSVGAPGGGFTPALTGPEPFAAWAEALPAHLPPALAAVVDDAVPTLVGPPAPLLARDGVPDPVDDADGEVEVRVAALPDAPLTLVDGALPGAADPAAPDAPVEVVLWPSVDEPVDEPVVVEVVVDDDGTACTSPGDNDSAIRPSASCSCPAA